MIKEKVADMTTTCSSQFAEVAAGPSDHPSRAGEEFDLKTARWKHQLDETIHKPTPPTMRQRGERLLKTPWVLALITFVLAVAVLITLRPPMILTASDGAERGRPSLARIVLWALLLALLVLAVPHLAQAARRAGSD